MFEWIRNLFAPPQPVAAPVAVPHATISVPPNTSQVANENVPPDLVGAANRVLAVAMSRMKVDRYGYREDAKHRPFTMPVKAVTLTGASGKKDRIFYDSGSNNPAELTITLSEPVGNYDIDSLNNAIHGVLGAIPGLQGHVTFSNDVKQQALNYADIWKQLESIIRQSGKFNQQDMGLMAQYFTERASNSATWNDYERIKVEHKEDRVQILVRAGEVKGDENVGISAEERVLGYFTQNRDRILELMREKVMRLPNLTGAGITAEDFKNLYFDINIKQPEGEYQAAPLLEFGTRKPDGTLDTTKLSKIDTDKVKAIFTESLMEVNKELPYVFGRIADNPMIAKVLRARLGDKNPQLEKILSYEMFEDRLSVEAKARENTANNVVNIGNALETDETYKLHLSFSLPHGMDLAQLRANIINAERQIYLSSARALPERGEVAAAMGAA